MASDVLSWKECKIIEDKTKQLLDNLQEVAVSSMHGLPGYWIDLEQYPVWYVLNRALKQYDGISGSNQECHCQCGHSKLSHTSGRREHNCWQSTEPDRNGFGTQLCNCLKYRKASHRKDAYR